MHFSIFGYRYNNSRNGGDALENVLLTVSPDTAQYKVDIMCRTNKKKFTF